MKTLRILTGLFFILSAGSPAWAKRMPVEGKFATGRSVFQTEGVRNCVSCMLSATDMGRDTYEVGAWLIERNGLFSCQGWPAPRDSKRVEFRGHIPPGAVAWIHTHSGGQDYFSGVDETSAKAVKLTALLVTSHFLSVMEVHEGKTYFSKFLSSGMWVPYERQRCQFLEHSRH